MKWSLSRDAGLQHVVGGVPKVSVSLASDASMAWVDVFHRMAEAAFHLVTGEVTPARANPLLAGMLHYRLAPIGEISWSMPLVVTSSLGWQSWTGEDLWTSVVPWS